MCQKNVGVFAVVVGFDWVRSPTAYTVKTLEIVPVENSPEENLWVFLIY